jgi:hypothetical protein
MFKDLQAQENSADTHNRRWQMYVEKEWNRERKKKRRRW